MNKHNAWHNIRWFCAALLLLLNAMVGKAQGIMTVNNCPAFVDTLSWSLLVSVPQETFGATLEATLTTAPAYRLLAIDGEEIEGGDNYRFEDIAGDKQWTISLLHNGTDTLQMPLQFTFLPIVKIDGDFGYDYTRGTLLIAEPGMEATQEMEAKIKWRGNTTNAEGKNKRNYSVKFVDENGEKKNRRLLGLRKDNHWILDAGQADMARVRNRVATDLWLDMATEPYYFDKAPEALLGARGQMVELFLGDTYRGIFSLGEAVDRKQLGLEKYDEETGTFHGGLWKTDSYTGQTGFKTGADFDPNQESCYGFATKYPDFEEVHPTDYRVLEHAVKVMDVSVEVEDFNAVVDSLFDMPVIMDYVIFYLTLNANDNATRNIYWLCHDRQNDPRLSISAWDLDASVGQDWSPMSWRPAITRPDYLRRPHNWQFRMLFHHQCKHYKAFINRYRRLRETWLQTDALVERYTTAINRLIACGAAAREVRRWNGNSDLYGHPLNFEEEREYITQWIETRMPLLDNFVLHHPCDVNNDGVVNVADVTALYNFILSSDGYDETLDTNLDGTINAADVTGIFGEIMNDTP